MSRSRTLWPRAGALTGIALVTIAYGGTLTPPAGPVAPTPGPEPRIAINATNTPGDADSIYHISQPGSYYLSGNLTGVSGKCGIEIAANDVSIDLMGFALVGVAGSLSSVQTTASLVDLDVHDGSVRSWGSAGILLSGYNTRIENVRSAYNGNTGFSLGSDSSITNCVSESNALDGFTTLASCVLSGCTAADNTGAGFTTGFGCTVTGCTALSNDGGGIVANTGTVVVSSAALANTVFGISASGGARVTDCTATNNSGDGILVGGDCSIIGNTCHGNGSGASDGAGIHANSSDARLEANTCTDNDRGIDVDGAGNIIVRNTCSGNTTNWDVAIGNVILVVNAATNASAVTGVAGGTAPGSTDPNANYTY